MRGRFIGLGLLVVSGVVVVLCVVTIIRSNDRPELCTAVEKNAQATRQLIITSVKSSRAPKIEALYRELGLPPYEVRYRQAIKAAQSLPGCH